MRNMCYNLQTGEKHSKLCSLPWSRLYSLEYSIFQAGTCIAKHNERTKICQNVYTTYIETMECVFIAGSLSGVLQGGVLHKAIMQQEVCIRVPPI